MQSSSLQKLVYVTAVRKIFVRQVAANNVAVKLEQENVENLKSWKEIPGPSSWPLIGPILHFLPGIGSIGPITGFKLFDKLYKTYGPIVRFEGFFGREPLVFVYDPDCIEQILRGENWMPIRPGFDSFEYHRKIHHKSNPIFAKGAGLIIESGEKWKSFRSAVNPVLMQPKTIKLYKKVIDEVAVDMVKRIKELRNDQNKIEGNIEIELNKWALESIGTVALGGRIGCLVSDLPEDSPARQLIKNVRDVFEIANELDFKPSIWKWFSTPTFRKAMNVFDEQLRLSKIFIKKAVKELESRKHPIPDEEKGVLEKLLEIDENIALIMASDMLFAGVDTAAHTSLATLYYLASNPKKQNKLREEIFSTTPEDRRPYLKACIKEAMRIAPVVGGNVRKTTKEYNLMGYKIPKDLSIFTMNEYMSTQEKQYPKAKDYIPERWIVEKGDLMHHDSASRFTTLPFGFGVRSCVGRRIAELEMETFIGRIIQNFEIDWIGEPPERVTASLNYLIGPFNFIFKDVKP